MLETASIIGFIPVRDTQSAEEFFAGRLGLTVVKRGPFALVVANAAGVEPILYPHFAQDGDGVWAAPGGAQVLWFNDPFGNVLSLSQHTGEVALQ